MSDRRLSENFLSKHPAESARILEAAPAPDAAETLTIVEPRLAASVVAAMSRSEAADLVATLDPEYGGKLIDSLDLDESVDLIRRLDSSSQKALIEASEADLGQAVRILLGFPEGTAGALMDPRVLTLPDGITVGEAEKRVRERPERAIYYLYILDSGHRLVGVLHLRDLMMAPGGLPIDDLMRRDPLRIKATAGAEQITAHRGWKEFHSLPVVDANDRFVGALRYETMRSLEDKPQSSPTASAIVAAVAFSELYWSGLRGILEGVSVFTSRRKPLPTSGEELAE